jgi:hypothetical protein
MMKRVRMSPDDRRDVILKAAFALTRVSGSVNSWSRQDVAHACTPPTSPETVKHYYLMPDLRDAVRVLLDK